MSTINTLKFDFRMQSEPFAHNLYARWDSFYANNVEQIADEVLHKLRMEDYDLRMEKLELDLGAMTEEDFDEQFPRRFREKLEEAIVQWKMEKEEGGAENSFSTLNSPFSILIYFLLHGSLPWYAAKDGNDIKQLFLNVLQGNANELKHFLQTYGHYTSLQQRLVYQLDDPELEKGVYLLAPGAGAFIVGYVHFLRAKHHENRQPPTTESHYRDAVWQVVYAYLLTQRSSYFDKKSLITQTIIRLAATYNLSYDNLLTRLTDDLEGFQRKQTVPIELFRLLASLQNELSEKQLKASFIDAAAFYRILYQSVQKESDNQVSENTREGLIRILENPYTCRQFLQHLSEPEMIRLIPVIMPHDSNFVIETAKLVERSFHSPFLPAHAWQAGSTLHSPFSVTWSIIFPILLEKRDTRFNRKQFVRAVFQQIAAHYNLTFHLLMESFLSQSEVISRIDRELKSILEELRVENGELGMKNGELRMENGELRMENGEWRVEKEKSRDEEKSQLLFNSHLRKKFIDQTREPERYRLVQQLFPNEQEFIISYIRSLDKLHERSALEAKAGGHFVDVKWMFLFAVLSEMPGDAFNRRSFVSRVLQQIAAHYNLTYFDLLRYFYQEKTGIQLPFHLKQLLDELYGEEQQHWLEMMVSNRQETIKNQYLACLKDIDIAFVKNILHALDNYHDKGVLQGKTSGHLNELKWRFVFEVLVAFPRITYNKKQFVRYTLTKMATHYQLSLEELLAYLKEIAAVSGNASSKEVDKIIRELYREQHKDTKAHKHEPEKKIPNKIQSENVPLSTLSMEENTAFVNNAGIMLLSPYLPRLFEMLHLTENNAFKDSEAKIRAIFLIQYIVFGTTDFPEHELILNKYLTGFEIDAPLLCRIEPTEKETDTVNAMLHSALQHWNKLKNTSIDGLREGFFRRTGKLEEKEDCFLLTVEEKAYDILLYSCPWNFRTIKYPWMKKMIHVKWR